MDHCVGGTVVVAISKENAVQAAVFVNPEAAPKMRQNNAARFGGGALIIKLGPGRSNNSTSPSFTTPERTNEIEDKGPRCGQLTT